MNNDQPPPSGGPGAWLCQLKKIWPWSPKDRSQLIDILRNSERHNLLDPEVLLMIEGALHVSDMRVRDIMVPKIQMDAIKSDASPEDIIKAVVESGHSRFPIIGEDLNDIQGILLAKDLLGYFIEPEQQQFDIKDVTRRAVFVPESKRLNVLLREFRTNRNHMAIVVDEYGVTGLVTFEDVIEEIIGEIADEHDIDEDNTIQQHGKNRYTLKATLPIEEFNEYFGTGLSDVDYDTIGGLIINAFGHLPKRGETIDFEGFNVKVLRADKRRIHILRLEKLPEKAETVITD